MMKKFVFADTSIFLHFQPLDQIDLVEILQCDAVELVIPPAVTEELEQQGWDHPSLSIRKRAQYCLRKIRSWLQTSDGLIRPGVEVTFCQGPKEETLREHHLLTRSPDDLIIANVLEYRRVHGREAVVLLTHDVRRQLKAHRHDLESISLPAQTMLPQVQDTARVEVTEPRREHTRYEGRAPRVELRFANGSRMLDVRLREEDLLTDEMIVARLDELRVWCEEPMRFRQIKAMPGVGDREAVSMLTNALLIPEEEYERFDHQLETFLGACEDWLRKRAEMMDSMRRTVRLDFELVNSGNATAEGIVVTLVLPKKLRWLEVLGDGRLPEPPKPPEPPRTHMEIVRESLSELYRSTLPPWSAGLETVEVPLDDTWMVEGQELRGLIDECLDQRAVELQPVYAVFLDPEEMSNFAISYVINQRNAPEPVDGKLLVRIA
jgi:hypothetical protein